MMLATFPQPPVDMVMPATAQTVSTVCLAVVALAMFIAALMYWVRKRDPLFVLGMLGGLVACVNEPFTNVVGMCYHPAIGQWPVVESFDRPIPVWAVLCYPVYFGGLSCLMLLWLRRGITRKRFWYAILIIMAGNAAFEFPILAAKVYVYYGVQPYQFFGMQPAFFVINVLGAVLGALAIAYYEQRLVGARKLFILLIPGVAQVAAYGVAAPHVFTLNTDLPLGAKYVGTTLTILLGLFVLDQLSQFSARRFPATSWAMPGAAEYQAAALADKQV
jgi:hypothetical protein